jgi:hypothetical protein
MCVLDKEDYLKEGYKQLSDITKYKKNGRGPDREASQGGSNLVEEAYQNGEIHESVKKFLTDKT